MAGIAVTAVFLAGLATLYANRSDAPAPPAAPTGARGPAAPPAPAGGTSGTSGVGGADRAGGVAAAIGCVGASQRWLYLPDDQLGGAVAEIAVPRSASRLIDGVASEVREARKRLGASPGPVWWLVRPLAVKVDRHDGDAMTVSVWTVTVLSAEQVAAPQSEWMTVTVDLEFSDRWRVANVADRPGPTPSPGPRDQPWNAVPFAEALAGFTRLDGEVAG